MSIEGCTHVSAVHGYCPECAETMRLVEAAIQDEREACARLADEQARIWGEGGSTPAVKASAVACRNVAEYIRARGQK